MMEKMIFGRFIPGSSFIHKMDPRAKLIFVFAFILLVFVTNNIPTYVALIVFTVTVVFVSRIRLYFLINGLKPVMILMIFHILTAYFLHEGWRCDCTSRLH